MLRLASSKVVSSSSFSTVGPNAVRAILSPTNIHASISAALSNNTTPNPNYFISHMNFSTTHHTNNNKLSAVDTQLLKAVNAEIKSMHSSLMPRPPSDFPFIIEDNPNENTLTLRRSLPGEEIFVSVAMPSFIPENDEDESSYKCCECGFAIPVLLYLKITKESAKIVDFGVSVSDHGIYVHRMSLIEPNSDDDHHHSLLCYGPYDMNRDEVGCELQCGLSEYVETRGVRKCDALFLYKYMVKKSKRQRLVGLEKLAQQLS